MMVSFSCSFCARLGIPNVTDNGLRHALTPGTLEELTLEGKRAFHSSHALFPIAEANGFLLLQ